MGAAAMSSLDDLTAEADRILHRQFRTNVAELATVMMKATSLPKLLAARKEAEFWSRSVSFAFTDDLSPEEAKTVARESRNEGPADALRHCFLAAMLARDLGYTDALEVLVAHEMNPEWGSPASQMDLLNNAVGLEIGVRMKGASNLDLQMAAVDALLQGRLVVVDKKNGNRLVPARSLTFGR
jgi:hypothetical protein